MEAASIQRPASDNRGGHAGVQSRTRDWAGADSQRRAERREPESRAARPATRLPQPEQLLRWRLDRSTAGRGLCPQGPAQPTLPKRPTVRLIPSTVPF